MLKSDFYYNLPQELIAQTPIDPRDSSRLLVLERYGSGVAHKHFYDIADLLDERDCLILNDTKVLPARLYATRDDSGAVSEFLLLKQLENDTWECVTKPGKRAKTGSKFIFSNELTCEVTDVLEDGNRILKFYYSGSFFDILDRIGKMPLPHYITEELQDKDRYQTVYSKETGSAAAPTAGLHFTQKLLEKIEKKGIDIGFVTLHVGLGTFRPVKTEKIEDHLMHSEHYYMPQKTADIINKTKANGGRVVAVGTTCCRTLESIAQNGVIREAQGETSIFIYPGYEFKCIDALITNFHLPESTLIMLVSAFYGYENTMNAYKIAVNEKYRFYSFGDAMFIS